MIETFDAFEAAGWQATANSYQQHWHVLTSQLSDPLLDTVAAGPDTRVLDVACGPGALAGRAVERGATAVGIDIADAMVELARHHFPRAVFQSGDAHDLPFADGSFDALVGNLGLPHFGRPERAVAEFRRVLVVGGRLALTTWDHPAQARLVGVLLESVQEAGAVPPATVPAGPNFFRFADEAELVALFADGGLSDVRVRTVGLTHQFDSTDELWDALLYGTVRTSAVIRGQPDDIVRRIRAGFDRRLAKYFVADRYEVPASFKLASAHRP